MAEENRVQLKQEEVVGNEVVLTDINPISNTASIDDSSNGAPMSQTMDRLWQSINGKLSRIVNSVNGRTGVVVLNAEDVGLGDVDNISFADIKQWVIDLLVKEFGNKRLCLVETLDEIDQMIANNDVKYRDRPFYSKYGYNDDKKAYIGYIAYNETEQQLEHEQMPIFTIGKTNNSIIYDEKVGESDEKDMTGGGIGVNIYKYEDALYLYNASAYDKDESGLRIDKTKLVGNFYFFNGIYGNGNVGDPNALISRTHDVSLPDTYLYFNGELLNTAYKMNFGYIVDDTSSDNISNKKLKVGDLVYCNFPTYYASDNDPVEFHSDRHENECPIIPNGMDFQLMNRQPTIGMVIETPVENDPSKVYRINFVSIKPNLGWGLEYQTNHTYALHKAYVQDDTLSLKLSSGLNNNIPNFEFSNMSGIQVTASTRVESDLTEGYAYASALENDTVNALSYAVLPSGSNKVYTDKFSLNGGIRITTDTSLCIQPQNVYGSQVSTTNKNCKAVDNWATTSPADYVINKPNYFNGALSDQSLIGINITKVIRQNPTNGLQNFVNCSGLKVIPSTDPNLSYDENKNRMLGCDHFGYSSRDEWVKEKWLNDNGAVVFHSGGLAVNVGDYLEIGHTISSTSPKMAVENARKYILDAAEPIMTLVAMVYFELDGYAPIGYYAYLLDGIVDGSTLINFGKVISMASVVKLAVNNALSALNEWVDWDDPEVKTQKNIIDAYINDLDELPKNSTNINNFWGGFGIDGAVAIINGAEEVLSPTTAIYKLLDMVTLTDPGTGPDFNKPIDQFNFDGKINVRIGDGLTGDMVSNRIKVNIKISGGLKFDPNGALYVSDYTPSLKSLMFTPSGPDGDSFTYNPTTTPITTPFQIELGPGLIGSR